MENISIENYLKEGFAKSFKDAYDSEFNITTWVVKVAKHVACLQMIAQKAVSCGSSQSQKVSDAIRELTTKLYQSKEVTELMRTCVTLGKEFVDERISEQRKYVENVIDGCCDLVSVCALYIKESNLSLYYELDGLIAAYVQSI